MALQIHRSRQGGWGLLPGPLVGLELSQEKAEPDLSHNLVIYIRKKNLAKRAVERAVLDCPQRGMQSLPPKNKHRRWSLRQSTDMRQLWVSQAKVTKRPAKGIPRDRLPSARRESWMGRKCPSGGILLTTGFQVCKRQSCSQTVLHFLPPVLCTTSHGFKTRREKWKGKMHVFSPIPCAIHLSHILSHSLLLIRKGISGTLWDARKMPWGWTEKWELPLRKDWVKTSTVYPTLCYCWKEHMSSHPQLKIWKM